MPSKPGRPRRHPMERLAKTREFRIRPSLDVLLIEAAAKNARSVSEEIEYRLARSFLGDDIAAAVQRGLTAYFMVEGADTMPSALRVLEFH